MARIRSIKPDFFDDIKIGKLSLGARLLYIGLWCLMDRQGIVPLEPGRFKSRIFPYDPKINQKEVVHYLEELKKYQLLSVIISDGKEYLLCRSFTKHQKFHRDEKIKYLIPEDIISTQRLTGVSTLLTGFGEAANSAVNCELLTVNGNLKSENRNLTPAEFRSVLVDIWNQNRGPLPEARGCKGRRKEQADARWKENPNPAFWEGVTRRIAQSPFCTGANDRGWVADFDFLVRPETAIRVMEGKYDARLSQQEKESLRRKQIEEQIRSEAAARPENKLPPEIAQIFGED